MNVWMNEWMMNEWINEWMNGWMDEWMNKWMNGWWMNGWWKNEWMPLLAVAFENCCVRSFTELLELDISIQFAERRVALKTKLKH